MMTRNAGSGPCATPHPRPVGDWSSWFTNRRVAEAMPEMPFLGARASCPRQTALSTLILGGFFLVVQRGYWISYMLFLQSRTGSGASFRDYTADQSHTPHAVMEAALAQTIRSKFEAAYARRTRRPSRSTRSLTTVSLPRPGLRTATRRPSAAGSSGSAQT